MKTINNFRTQVDVSMSVKKISHDNQLIIMGSCFSDSMRKYFSKYCFSVFNPFGTIYNPISLSQNIKRAMAKNMFSETELLQNQEIFLSWFHSGKYFNQSKNLLLSTINQQQVKLVELVNKNATLLVTFGTSKVYEFLENNQIVANCHKQPNNKFINRRLEISEIVNSWRSIFNQISNTVIITISPVRHLKDGFVDNNKNKATLFLAIDQLCNEFDHVHYFPSFEILIDELRDYRFYASDWIHPSNEAIDYIWYKLSEQLFDSNTLLLVKEIEKIRNDLNHQPNFGKTKEYIKFMKRTLEKVIKIKNQTKNYDWSKEIKQLNAILY